MELFHKQTRHAIQTLRGMLFFKANFKLLQRVKQSLTTSHGTLLACLRGRLPVNFSQSLSVSWEPTAVTSQVPEAEIGILSWCKFSLLSRRVPPFQSSKACITCHQPQVSFHRSNVNKYIHYHQKGRKQPMLVPESLLVLL